MGGEPLFLRIEVGAAVVDHALGIAEDELGTVGARGNVVLRAGNPGGTGAVHHEPAVSDLLADHAQGVQDAGEGDDGGAVLVVVEDRDLHRLLQRGLDGEARGRADVFEVDAAERGFQAGNGLDHLIGVGAAVLLEHAADAERNGVDVGEAFEEDGFALHDGESGLRADVAEPEHGRAVADHGHGVGAPGVIPYLLRVVVDFDAGDGDAGRVRQGKVVLRGAGFRGQDLQFARLRIRVVGKAAGGKIVRHGMFSKYFVEIVQFRCGPGCRARRGSVSRRPRCTSRSGRCWRRARRRHGLFR